MIKLAYKANSVLPLNKDKTTVQSKQIKLTYSLKQINLLNIYKNGNDCETND